jgi:hypothetical protein
MNTLAIMVTMTTYGIWLRGDQRGWVEDGKLMPPDPIIEAHDRRLMTEEPFLFPRPDLLGIGNMIGNSLRSRLKQRILALTMQTWHSHFVVVATDQPIAKIVKCAKDAVRWGLRANRPIWTERYDNRFCFDEASVQARINYVERHNLENGWPAKPWDFLEPFSPR